MSSEQNQRATPESREHKQAVQRSNTVKAVETSGDAKEINRAAVWLSASLYLHTFQLVTRHWPQGKDISGDKNDSPFDTSEKSWLLNSN